LIVNGVSKVYAVTVSDCQGGWILLWRI